MFVPIRISTWYLGPFNIYFRSILQVYSKVSGEAPLEKPTIDVSSKEFYGEGYDDSDKRIPDMTIINRQLGMFPCSTLPLRLLKYEKCWEY